MTHIGIDARELSGHPTGVGRYLQRLLAEWSRVPTGCRWTLYSPDGRLAVPPGLDAQVAVVAGSGGTLWEQGALAAAVRADRPDVFFAPGYTAPLGMRVPLVVAMHDVSFAARPEWFSWHEGVRRRFLARRAARKARAVLTLSTFSRREIERHLGIPGTRVHVVPLGVGLATTPPAVERDPLVLYVGSIFNRRHVPALLNGFAAAAATRPGLSLDVVGANRTHPRQDLRAIADASGAGDRITLRDWVDDEELSRLYTRASAFVFLSEYEGFGLTPLEALAAGVPPVVLDTPVAREVLDTAAIYVSAPTSDAVAEALGAVLTGSERRRLLEAAPAVLARYDWRRTADATLAHLLEAARR
jgi:glycosyltransferase involved in cell wall biosynthesis